MSFPDFYDPRRVGQLFLPRIVQSVEAGRATAISPASSDERRVILLLVDTQVDFIHTDGALSVPGAVDDTRRTIEWLFDNLDEVSTIAASLDSHVPIQIFSPSWWVDGAGNHPNPFTPITSKDVESKRWRPLYEVGWSIQYVEKLERGAKKELMIWPYHCLVGTPGHNLTPALFEAVVYHSAARQAQPEFLTKGSIPQTEHYSIMEPEVKVHGQPQGELNTTFLHMLASHDLIYVAGQAKSHCVLETVASIMRYFGDRPEITKRVRILMDCTSSVAHPEIDFDTLANEAFARYETEGLRPVRSSDPIG